METIPIQYISLGILVVNILQLIFIAILNKREKK